LSLWRSFTRKSSDKKNYKTPEKWYKFPTNKTGQSFCCGVILFNKLDVLEEWWEEALKYVDYLQKIGGYSKKIWSVSSLIFEQHFIASICKHHKLKVGFLTDYQTKPNANMTYIDNDLAKELGYTHMLSTSKRETKTEELVRERLLLEGIVIKNKN
jgi:hypothetical protein